MTSEFATLEDLAVARGISHSDLISTVKAEVLSAFRDKFPKSPADATVLVDSTTGLVRIYSGTNDAPPPKFADTASSIARQAVMAYLSQDPVRTVTSPKPKNIGSVGTLLANLFFWGYNLYFLLFSLVTSLYYLSFGWANIKSTGFFRLFLSAVLLVTPGVSIFIALKKRLFQFPAELLRYFFLLEAPVVIASLVPLFLLTQTTPFMTFLVLGFLSLPAIFYFYQSHVYLSPLWQKLLLFVEQFALMLTAYLLFLFSFFVPLILGGIARELFGRLVISSSIYPPQPPIPDIPSLFWGITILLIVSLLLLLPFLILLVLWRAFRSTYQSLRPPPTLMATYVAVILTLAIAFSYQPSQVKLLSSLAKISTVSTFAQKDALATSLVPHKDRLKQLIIDSQSYRYKYLFTKNDTSLQSGYQQVFDLGKIPSSLIQKVFLAVAYPFVYQGESSSSYQLAQNYQYLFGVPYYQTASMPTPVPAKNVLLSSRKVSHTPSPDGFAATITIDEEYDNQTFTQAEVIYEFTLPGDSVMTDLKLGPDLEFQGIIAPKGAAQRTYEQQLQVRRDPALLEVTGPRQYRLRVFPIPAKNDLATLKGRRQRIAYTYMVSATPDGFPLPHITHQTNVFASSATRYLGISQKDKFISAGSRSPSEELRAIPGDKIAIFYDVSASSPNGSSLSQLLSSDREFFSKNTVDLYKYNELVSDKVTLTPDNYKNQSSPVRFGQSGKISSLSTGDRYDLILIIPGYVDAYESLPFSPPTKIYLVYPDNIPPFSLKFTSQLLQTGGNVSNSVANALYQYAHSTTPPSVPPSLTPLTSPLAPLLNQQLFRAYLTSVPTEVSGDITQLDKLHQFAIAANIATPYSSFISLVNEQQLQQLKDQSQFYNRFQDQALRENIAPQPIPLEPPMRTFDITAPGGSMFGAPLKTQNFELGTPSLMADCGGSSFLPSLSLFVIANAVLLAIGLTIYLLKLLRKKT